MREGWGTFILFSAGVVTLLRVTCLNAVRASSPDAMQVGTMVADAFDQGRSQPDAGTSGPETFEHIVRVLSRGSCCATPGAVKQLLVVDRGAPFATYLSKLKLLVLNVRSVATIAPDVGTVQLAVKTGVDDQ